MSFNFFQKPKESAFCKSPKQLVIFTIQSFRDMKLPVKSPINDATKVRRARKSRTTRTTRTTRARRPMRRIRMMRKLVFAARPSPLTKSTPISIQDDTTTNKSSQFQAQAFDSHTYSIRLPDAKLRSRTWPMDFSNVMGSDIHHLEKSPTDWLQGLTCKRIAEPSSLQGENDGICKMNTEKCWDLRNLRICGSDFHVNSQIERVSQDQCCPKTRRKVWVHDICNFLLPLSQSLEFPLWPCCAHTWTADCLFGSLPNKCLWDLLVGKVCQRVTVHPRSSLWKPCLLEQPLLGGILAWRIIQGLRHTSIGLGPSRRPMGTRNPRSCWDRGLKPLEPLVDKIHHLFPVATHHLLDFMIHGTQGQSSHQLDTGPVAKLGSFGTFTLRVGRNCFSLDGRRYLMVFNWNVYYANQKKIMFKETAASDITLASNASKSYQQITRGHKLICGLAPLTHSARPLFLEEPEKVPLGEPTTNINKLVANINAWTRTVLRLPNSSVKQPQGLKDFTPQCQLQSF